MTEKPTTELAEIRKEIEHQLADPETLRGLIATTFKGLTEVNVRQALLEGMGRGFKFEDFLKKDVYAISYGNGYNLVTGIDYNRKIGMRSGVIGVTEPEYEFDPNGNPTSCSVTVKRRVGQDIGEYSAKVFFREYTTGKNLWQTKPLTMIAKVAEMHALRKACPEELSQSYVEEELEQRSAPRPEVAIDLDALHNKLTECKSLEQLARTWANLPSAAKKALESTKDEMKAILTTEAANEPGV